ncbi:MAG: hypothetical protein OXO52_22275 [Rhodospirillales bacterium]|nr:hypothetical protein [Rhodospirillales bacterium]MDE0380751.1 hypothetical protein [Rhodospirillales bacterium]
MANSFASLYRTLFSAMAETSRELIGMIPAVSIDATGDMAALGQTITIPVAPAQAVEDVAASNISTTGANRAIDPVQVSISKSRHSSFHLTAEEEMALVNGGTASDVMMQSVMEAFRALTNEVEKDLAVEAAGAASRAVGTAGTTPFGTKDDLGDFAQPGLVLDLNGAPIMNRSLVIDPEAKAKLIQTQASIFRVDEHGDPLGRRRGIIGMINNLDVGTSGGLGKHTPGAGSGYLVNHGAGYAIGDTAIVIDTGSGALKRGDVITFADDDHQYVIAQDRTGAGTLHINKPGLRQALANNKAITSVAAFSRNVALAKSAVVLVARPPAVPSMGDAGVRTYMQDPVTGLVFEIATFPQVRQNTFEVGLAWGVKAVRSEHIALLLG